jgi:hypothetical protein
MKYVSSISPVFTPSAGTLDFSAYAGQFNVAQVVGVVDVTADQTLYLPGIPGLGISALSANGLVMTLQANVSALAATDILQIFYDDGQGLGADANQVVLPQGASGVRGALSSIYGAISAQKNPSGTAGAIVRAMSSDDLLSQILAELKLINVLLLQGFNLPEDLNDLRSELAQDMLS